MEYQLLGGELRAACAAVSGQVPIIGDEAAADHFCNEFAIDAGIIAVDTAAGKAEHGRRYTGDLFNVSIEGVHICQIGLHRRVHSGVIAAPAAHAQGVASLYNGAEMVIVLGITVGIAVDEEGGLNILLSQQGQQFIRVSGRATIKGEVGRAGNAVGSII